MSDLTTSEWDDWLATHPQAHLLQSSAWARLKGEFGWSAARVVVRKQGTIQAGAQILFRHLPFNLATIAYIPKGPITDWHNAELTSYLLAQCVEVAKSGRAIFLKIEPDLAESAENRTLLAQYGLQSNTRTIQPRQTITLDISGTSEQILAAMKQKTRYNIRLSQKKEITTRIGTDKDLPAFFNLMVQTGKRDAFALHNTDYYQRAYEIFQPLGQADLLLAEFAGKPLAAIMAFALGSRAYYLYGASSDEERNRMPTYAVQWAAVEWGQRHGCATYDLYGIPDEPEAVLEAEFENRQDGLWQVYRFKRGFGGQIQRTVGAFDLVLNPWLYRLALRFGKL
ncbi:MAG TPA: peptidoglycan bridge formation glycyltransferase FemA/FemB family protein [Anaerolineales bacterium]|nr:peptidoglycan bridge formation glycyltransferase FemA/FemB family protein [Anaerolineales bacterium]